MSSRHARRGSQSHTRFRRAMAPPLLPLLGLALLMAGCGDDPAALPDTAGTLRASLVSPNGAEGAALIDVSGPGIREITTTAGRLFTDESGGTTQVLVILDTPGAVRLDVLVNDTLFAPTASIVEVAGPDNAIRDNLSGYTMSFVR